MHCQHIHRSHFTLSIESQSSTQSSEDWQNYKGEEKHAGSFQGETRRMRMRCGIGNDPLYKLRARDLPVSLSGCWKDGIYTSLSPSSAFSLRDAGDTVESGIHAQWQHSEQAQKQHRGDEWSSLMGMVDIQFEEWGYPDSYHAVCEGGDIGWGEGLHKFGMGLGWAPQY